MSIFIIVLLAIAITLALLRFKQPIGIAILISGLFIWLCTDPTFNELSDALIQMLSKQGNYDLVGALYLVVCLEIELRKSGALAGMVQALYRMFKSPKFTLAIMPAFLGLLPSIGGARFSAPIVEEASKGVQITAEQKAGINFWFRHIFEFSSPLIPGMILACGIAGVKIGDLILHLGWLTIVAFVAGWLFLIQPLKVLSLKKPDQDRDLIHKHNVDFILSLVPVIANVILMVVFGLNAALSMAIVVVGMIPILMLMNRAVSIRDIFVGALDWKLLANVLSILLFIQILDTTGLLSQIVQAFQSSVLPIPVIIAMISFVIGMLTGLSQGHVAIVMPIVAALSMGNLSLVGIAMVFGVAGQMITPTHVCLTITVDYFKSDFFKTLGPVILAQLVVLITFAIVTYLTW